MIELLCLIIGLLIGFYARVMFDYVKRIYTNTIDKIKYNQAGVVKPNVALATRNQPVNLESKTGSIRRLNPDEVLLARAKERETNIHAM